MRINLMIAKIVDRIEDYEEAARANTTTTLTMDELYDARANITLYILAQHGFRDTTTQQHEA